MTNKFVLKKDIVYRIYKDQWGSHKRFYANFDTMTQFNIGVTFSPLYVSADDQKFLLDHKGRVLPSHIQRFYKEYTDAEVERLLTGDIGD